MANEPEIGINLKLKMDEVAKDAAAAGRTIAGGLASSVKGLGKSSVEREDEAAAARMLRERVIRRRKIAEEEARYEKNRPKPPVLPKTPQNRGFPIAPVLAGMGLGVPGLGAVASLASVHPAAAALVGAFRLTSFAAGVLAREFHRAAESSRRLYAKTLTSGFNTGFVAKRGLLANTIGIGEDEVYQFGAAVGYLNKRLELAGETITKTNRVLTASAWNFAILDADIDALKSKIAYELAPAFNLLTNSLDELVKFAIKNSEKILSIGGGSLLKTFTANNPVLGGLITSILPSLIPLIKGAGAQEAPPPVAFMKQMPASQWEHMGLVVGSGGGVNYGKNTADNTKRAAEILALLPSNIAAAFAQYVTHAKNPSIPAMP